MDGSIKSCCAGSSPLDRRFAGSARSVAYFMKTPYKLSKALPATLPFALYFATLSGAVVGAAGLVVGTLGQDFAALADALRILSVG